MNGTRRKRKRLRLLLLCLALCVGSAACCLGAVFLGGLLPTQRAAERWQGESKLAFSQISCFVPVDETLKLGQIYKFRTDLLDKLHGAALDLEGDKGLFVDAWSCGGKALAMTDLGKGEANVIAVGGDFFHFHPLRLYSGSYISESDLMKDRVLLDEDLAWLLFGGTQLQGMELKIDGIPFVVAGVIEREQDFASRRAYTAGMGLYMSFDAWQDLHEDAGANCYELVMAEPVKGFAVNFAREKFPIGGGEILQNTGRFAFWQLLSLVGQFGSRSMQRMGVVLPYWENAARCVEDWGALLCFLTLLLALIPAIVLTVCVIRLLRRGKERLADELLPAWRDSAEEAVRVRRRRHWEKKHGLHEKRDRT